MANFKAILKIYGIYDANWNFRNELIDEQDPTDWTFTNPTNIARCMIKGKYTDINGNVHLNIIQVKDSSGVIDTEAEVSIGSQTTGIVEWYFAMDDVGADILRFQFGAIAPSFDNHIDLRVAGDQLDYFAAGVGWTFLANLLDATFYRIRIDFDTTPDTFDIYLAVDTDDFGAAIAVGIDFRIQNGVPLTKLTIKTTTTAVYGYIDAVGVNGLNGYTTGDNQFLEPIDITADIIKAKIEEELYIISFGEITVKGNILSYTPGSLIEFYDINVVLSWTGIILAPELTAKGEGSNDYVSVISLVGISSYYEAIYRKNYTTVRDSDYILKDIIDSFLTKFHSYGTLIDNFTITYKYDLKKPILKMMYYLAMLERGVLHHLPGGEIFFNKYDNLKSINDEHYQGSGGFNYETPGAITAATDMVWLDSITLYDGSLTLGTYLNHYNMLRLQDDATAAEDPIMIHDMTQATSGVLEYWIGTNNVTELWYIQIQEVGVGNIIFLRITSSKIQYFDSLDAWQDIQAVVNDILYHIKIVWRADNTFDVYVGETKQVDNVACNNNQVSGIDRILISCAGDSTDYLYFDAPGLVGETDPRDIVYVEGDNLGFTILQHRVSKRLSITKYVPAANRYITRAPVIGAYNSAGQVYVIGVAATQVADELQFGIRELQAWRDSEITNYTEAHQLATNLQAIYNKDTQFITLLTQGYGHFQVGHTMYLKSSIVFEITGQEFLIIRRIWYPTTDLCELVVTDNILPEAQFNKRIIQKLYDIEAQQSYEDSDISEVGADGVVTPLVSLALLRSIIGLTTVKGSGPRGVGYGAWYINKTGAASVYGEGAQASSTTDFAYEIADADSISIIGVVHTAGVPDGEWVLIIHSGRADHLLKDNTISLHGVWVETANVAGRFDMTGGAPPGAVAGHFEEAGHCLQTVNPGGINKTAEATCHYL